MKAAHMKPAPAPHVPGNTQQERMDYAAGAMFRVSKDEVIKEEAKRKRAREKKRAKAKRA